MFTADVPRWRQLADLIKERIAAGLYQPRQPIPSEHALVQETGLSRSTVQKSRAWERSSARRASTARRHQPAAPVNISPR